jgi:LacI family fructose operon transcriptional repressor
MTIGIKDVAKTAGVSAATVSRVLGNGPVSAELRDKVEAAIRSTGYRPNLSARRLRSQHSNTIGLIVSDIRNPFFTALSRAVEDAAYQANMRVVLCNIDENPNREAMYLRLMQEERITGLIYAPTRIASDRLDRMEFDFPVVLVDRTGPIGRHDSVVLDNFAAAGTLVDHLYANGRRAILGVFGNTSSTAIERASGYRAAIAERGLSERIELVPPNAEAAVERLAALITGPDRPDAVICSNGLILLGAVKALHRAGLETPRDVALAGFDNEIWTELVGPGLTVIEQPVAEIGRTAMTLLFERLALPDMAPRKIVLSGKLIARGSTAAA